MGKKEDSSPKTDTSANEFDEDLEDVDENTVVDEIPDDVLLNEPLDDDDLTADMETITSGKKTKKIQNKRQAASFSRQSIKKAVKVSQTSTLEGPDADDDILSEMEGILSGKASSPPLSQKKSQITIHKKIGSSIYIRIIHALLFLEICLLGGYYIPYTLLLEVSGGKFAFLALHGIIAVIIIVSGILYFRYSRIAVLISFIIALWNGLSWLILYFWIGFPISYAWWAFPLLCVVVSGFLVYFTILCVLHDPNFGY